nr:hypothetical protein [Tanacetum cinerariifolium]
MQELWVTTTVHHHSICFKMDNKKHIIDLESFREMLHICPRLHDQSFVEPPFEEEILAFLRFLRHSRAIRRLTDVEHKDTKKSNEMYYPWFTKVIIHHFMSKDPSIPRRNKAFLVTADVPKIYMQEFWVTTTVHHHSICFKMDNKKHIVDLESFREMLHICPRLHDQSFVEPPFEEEILAFLHIMNFDAYKEYYAVATGATPPKPKASPRLSTSAKGKQPGTTSKAKSLSVLSEVAMTEAQQLKLATKKSLQQTHISQASGFGADEGTGKKDTMKRKKKTNYTETSISIKEGVYKRLKNLKTRM